MERGLVLWFNNATGVGRIRSNEHGDKLFVSFAFIVMEGFKTLEEGQLVEYERVIGPGPGPDGLGRIARSVRPVQETVPSITL
jgi:CspA family cold shock protein